MDIISKINFLKLIKLDTFLIINARLKKLIANMGLITFSTENGESFCLSCYINLKFILRKTNFQINYLSRIIIK